MTHIDNNTVASKIVEKKINYFIITVKNFDNLRAQMNITIDQALALDAIAKYGTFQKSANALGKGHSAIMYLIKMLEEETQLKLLDRSAYRNRLTPEGQLVHKHCLQLLKSKEELVLACKKLHSKWEPRVSLVYDGVIDFERIGNVLRSLNESEVPTEIKVTAAYLDEVETRFDGDDADMMLTILPNQQLKSPSIRLKPLKLLLVAHKNHRLGTLRGKIALSDLTQHTYISVRGATAKLGLSTEQMEIRSLFLVNDFYTKKQAILKCLGYGWLPEYMISKEINNKTVRVLKTDISSEHILYPRLYHREKSLLGNGAMALLKAFKGK